jgi:hypothetical protein
MQLEASLSWLALGLTPGLASRLSARVLRRFESPDGVFHASLPDLYELLSEDQSVHLDNIVERSGLNSSQVLATLFTLEMKGIVRRLPGETVQQSLAVEADRGLHRGSRKRHPNTQKNPPGPSLHQSVDPVGIRAERLR